MQRQRALPVASAAGHLAGFAPGKFRVTGRLARLGGANLLFGPVQGGIFALNDTAADIWRSIEEGTPVDVIAQAMASTGLGRQEAARYIEAALLDWERCGLIEPAPPGATADDDVRQVVSVAGIGIRILYPPAHALPAATALRHLEAGRESVNAVFRILEHGRRLHLFRNGRWADSCGADELPCMLKGQLLTEVLSQRVHELALHAATLVRGTRALLLCGRPGAGKTTLTLALTRAGFGFAGDDVALLEPGGLVIGLPFAPAVKAGAWQMVAAYAPEIGQAPVWRRADRRRVRYLVPAAPVPALARPVGWIILIRRSAGVAASLQEVGPSEVLAALMAGALGRGTSLSVSAFDALTEAVRFARAWRLVYSRLDEALELIRAACR